MNYRQLSTYLPGAMAFGSTSSSLPCMHSFINAPPKPTHPVDVEVWSPCTHTDRPILIAPMPVGVRESSDFITDGHTQVSCNREVEGGAEACGQGQAGVYKEGSRE